METFPDKKAIELLKQVSEEEWKRIEPNPS